MLTYRVKHWHLSVKVRVGLHWIRSQVRNHLELICVLRVPAHDC